MTEHFAKKIVELYEENSFYDLFDLLVRHNLKIDCGFVYDESEDTLLKLTDNTTTGYLLQEFFEYYCNTRFYEY